jgi:PTH1 family peptidyl-tRNA hydrolase
MEGKSVALAKPTTYMNNSGIAVKELMEEFGVSSGQLIVITDDFALPLGSIRVRSKGSDGGHNGLYSIIYQLGANDFPRIRCGIRKAEMPAKEKMAEFVLAQFDRGEEAEVKAMVLRAAEAAATFVTDGIEQTMNTFNTRLQNDA